MRERMVRQVSASLPGQMPPCLLSCQNGLLPNRCQKCTGCHNAGKSPSQGQSTVILSPMLLLNSTKTKCQWQSHKCLSHYVAITGNTIMLNWFEVSGLHGWVSRGVRACLLKLSRSLSRALPPAADTTISSGECQRIE